MTKVKSRTSTVAFSNSSMKSFCMKSITLSPMIKVVIRRMSESTRARASWFLDSEISGIYSLNIFVVATKAESEQCATRYSMGSGIEGFLS
jgi:hypothetical protein